MNEPLILAGAQADERRLARVSSKAAEEARSQLREGRRRRLIGGALVAGGLAVLFKGLSR